MPNHKKHIFGGVIAYGATLAFVVSFSHFFKTTTFISAKNYSLLPYLPTILADAQETLHEYFKAFLIGLSWLINKCWPTLLLAIEWFLCSLAGSMFPDIDIKSKSQKYWYCSIFVILLAFIGRKKLTTVAYLSVFSFLPLFTNHRGLFHRLWFILSLSVSAWFWLAYLFPEAKNFIFYDIVFFTAGVLSHLYLDMGIKMLRF